MSKDSLASIPDYIRLQRTLTFTQHKLQGLLLGFSEGNPDFRDIFRSINRLRSSIKKYQASYFPETKPTKKDKVDKDSGCPKRVASTSTPSKAIYSTHPRPNPRPLDQDISDKSRINLGDAKDAKNPDTQPSPTQYPHSDGLSLFQESSLRQDSTDFRDKISSKRIEITTSIRQHRRDVVFTERRKKVMDQLGTSDAQG